MTSLDSLLASCFVPPRRGPLRRARLPRRCSCRCSSPGGRRTAPRRSWRNTPRSPRNEVRGPPGEFLAEPFALRPRVGEMPRLPPAAGPADGASPRAVPQDEVWSRPADSPPEANFRTAYLQNLRRPPPPLSLTFKRHSLFQLLVVLKENFRKVKRNPESRSLPSNYVGARRSRRLFLAAHERPPAHQQAC